MHEKVPTTPTERPTPGTWTMRELLRADFEAAIASDPLRPRGPARTLDVLTQPGYLFVVIYRLASGAKRRDRRVIARLLLLLQAMLFGGELYPGAIIGPGLTVLHPQGVGVGAGVVIGRNARLHANVRVGSAGYRDPTRDGFPTIGDDCILYDSAMVFGPVEVGDRTRVGAAALLMESVPPDSLVTAPPSIIRRAGDRASGVRQ